MEWIPVAGLLGLAFLLINLSANSSFAKNQEKKALKNAREWAKKNPQKVRRAKNIDKKIDSGLSLIFKIIFICIISVVGFYFLHPILKFFAAFPLFLAIFGAAISLAILLNNKSKD